MVEDANTLLDINDLPLVPERNNYEELMNHVRQSADCLVEIGQAKDARSLLRRLADRFPGSALAGDLEAKIGSIVDVVASGAAN